GLIDAETHSRLLDAIRRRREGRFGTTGAAAQSPAHAEVRPAIPMAQAAPMPALTPPPVHPFPPREMPVPMAQIAPRPSAPVAPVSAPRRVMPPVPVRPPRAPRRPLSQVLSGFMEERNIRWGELAGGLLIVGSSVALVLSFWGQIAERPFFKFGVF